MGALRQLLDPARPLVRRVRGWVDERPPPPPHAFAHFGDGSWIVPPTEVVGAAQISIGAGVIVLEHGSLLVAPDARLTIGAGARLARDVHIRCTTEVIIEEDVSTSDYVAIIDTWGAGPGERARALPTPHAAPIHIGRGAYLGCGSVVGPGVRIGVGAYVGEGAVVVHDVPDHDVVYGNPALRMAR